MVPEGYPKVYLKIPNERLNMGSCSADRSAGRFGIVIDRKSGFQPNSHIRRDTFPNDISYISKKFCC